MRLLHRHSSYSIGDRRKYFLTFLNYFSSLELNCFGSKVKFIPLWEEITFYESSTKSLFDDFSVKLKTVALSVGGMLLLIWDILIFNLKEN